MAHTKACDLEAFCATCPSTQEVINLLQALGFELTFHMDIDASPEYEQVPPLPAQFHFLDKHGTEAIFLAGTDGSPFFRVKAIRTGVIHHTLHSLAERPVGRDESRPYERSSSLSTLFHLEGRRPHRCKS